MKVIIVGGGISGLVTAFYLKKKQVDVTLLEASDRVGGNIKTSKENGFLYEHGPNSILANNNEVFELNKLLGLEQEVIEANKQSKKRFIVKNNQLNPIPMNPISFLTSPLLNFKGKLDILSEPFKPKNNDELESLASFVQRRIGEQALTWMINPFISGIYAGDPAKLSVAAAMPKLYNLESTYGSLIKGTLYKIKQKKSFKTKTISYKDGLESLIFRLSLDLKDNILVNQKVFNIYPENNQWNILSDQGEFKADKLILSTPAYITADLLSPLSKKMAKILKDIVYPPVVSIGLGYKKSQIQHPLDGFGALIPRILNIETLGVLFSSTLFPQRAPEDHALLTCFIGGRLNESIAQYDENLWLNQVLEDIQPLLGITGDPSFIKTSYWPQAIPQYELGYLEKMRWFKEELAQFNNLYMRANWQGGIALGDCIEKAKQLADTIV